MASESTALGGRHPAALEPAGLEVVPDEVGKVVVPNDAGKVVVPNNDGKVVVPTDDGLHVAADNNSKFLVPHDEGPQVIHDRPDLYLNTPSPANEASKNLDETKSIPWWKRKRYIAIAAILAIVVILAAVLGGVLGSRANDSSSSGDSDSSIDEAPRPTSIASGSPLAVAAASYRGDYADVALIFQDPEGNVRMSTRPVDVDGDGRWSSPRLLESDFLSPEVSGLSIAPVYYPDAEPAYFLSLLAVNESSYLNRVNMSMESTDLILGGEQDSELAAQPGTRPATYGPWFAFASTRGTATVGRFYEDDEHIPAFGIVNDYDDIELLPAQGAKFALIPLQINFTNPRERFDMVFFHQIENGTLFSSPFYEIWDRPVEDDQIDVSPIASWPDEEFPEITFPMGNSIAALVTAREQGNETVNIFVLYQDENLDIQQVWTDDGETWQTSSPEVMRGVDNGTDIACMSMAMSPDSVNNSNSNNTLVYPAYMTTSTYLSRCYFQRQGVVREVRLDGTDWVELGDVPIP